MPSDENKFGQKILEKMGWSKGKGLGRQEQGQVEPVRLSYKNDTQGMGFKGHDDDWLCHRDEFSAMLNELNGAETPAEAVTENLPIKSLEVRSKTSKARVHYHKFTRGKDLSRYSSEDLACILGKRATNTSEEANKTESEEDEGISSETEKCQGLVTINKGNINDYFAAKMAALKQNPPTDNNLKETEIIHHKETKEKPNKTVQFREELTEVKEFISYEEEKALKKKEKSSKKKRKDNQENGEALLLESSAETETERVKEPTKESAIEVVETETKKKKRKKDKKTEVDAEAQVGVVEFKIKKEKKEKKKKAEKEAVIEEVAAQSEDEGALKEKKKKKKKKDNDKEEYERNETTDRDQGEPTKDKGIPKEESITTVKVTAESRPEQVNTTPKNDINTKKMKKRKKLLQLEAEETTSVNDTIQIENPKKRKHCEAEEISNKKKSKTEPQNDASDTLPPQAKYPENPNFSYLANAVKPEKIKRAAANYSFADFQQFKGSNLHTIAGYGH